MAVSPVKLTAVISSVTALVAALPPIAQAVKTSAVQTKPATTPAVPTAPVAPAASSTRYGVNVTGVIWWAGERSFMNLMAGASWQDASNGWAAYDPAKLDRSGNVLVEPGHRASTGLTTPPAAHTRDVSIHCTWSGEGVVTLLGATGAWAQKGQTLDYNWGKGTVSPAFIIESMSQTNPMRGIDCREAGADRTALFDPAFVDSLRPYNTVRFMEWQLANQNNTVTWADRSQPSGGPPTGPDGVAVEHMVALANAARVNPWFTMPFNADNDYMERFARYVHDHLDKSLVAYVEMGNEVWNFSFASAQQAFREGMAQHLDPDGNVARMRYQAQKTTATMVAWEKAYTTADDRKRLVRIMAGQAVWPELVGNALQWQGAASHIDAIAFAPYFGLDLLTRSGIDLSNTSALFNDLTGDVDDAVAVVKHDKDFAKSWNKRMIAYEAGQHVIYYGADGSLVGKINRDARIGDAYRRYMAGWAANGGDLMNFYESVSPVTNQFAWGLAEYSGQAMAETPKRKAVLDAAGPANQR